MKFREWLNDNYLYMIESKGKFTPEQLKKLDKEYSKIQRIDPDKPTYKKLNVFMDKLSKEQLQQIKDAKIKWLMSMANIRLMKK